MDNEVFAISKTLMEGPGEALFDHIGGKPTDWRLLELWRAMRPWGENSALVLLAPHVVAEVKAKYTAAIGDDPDPNLENEVSFSLVGNKIGYTNIKLADNF